MIGVVANRNDLDMVREFFELFKTPWELAVRGRKYRVVLSSRGGTEGTEGIDAERFLVYGSGEQEIDHKIGAVVNHVSGPIDVEWGESTFPIYGQVISFERDVSNCTLKTNGKDLDYQGKIKGRAVWRIGYDLFEEVRYLLTKGQPVAQAPIPTLELHIALLRHVLIESRIPFFEIPPRPAGHSFICCLTHDVDFFGIRRHMMDRTMMGFLYRASVGTLVDFLRSRRSLTEMLRNWKAFCSLPFVFAGIAQDFWRPFVDYAKVEEGRRSTFFLIPFKGRSGLAPDGAPNPWRASPYGMSEIHEEMKKASARGSELAVHGIDAWRDADAGRQEMRQLTSLMGTEATGIRMHWLYFSADSPRILEDAGFDYDSTMGYNDAVGYRAGTSQAFRPMGSERLIELPMSIMDSALFSSGRMNLSPEKASQLCSQIVANARRFGGTIVINWHERSLAPERLWGRFYSELVGDIGKGEQAWFAKAGETVEWFRWRRTIRFQEIPSADAALVKVSAARLCTTGAVIRIHRPGVIGPEIEDLAFDGATSVEIRV
jgi:hypothetical protein